MKKITSVFAKLALIFAASGPLSTMASQLYHHHYHGELIIHNNTPFTLAITDDYMIKPDKEEAEFVFDDYFKKAKGLRLLPGEEYYIGHAKVHTHKIEGYLTFNFLHTDKSFNVHYRFSELWHTSNSWVKLEQPENGHPHPGISLGISHASSSHIKKRLFSQTIHHSHTFALSLTTSDSDAVCIMDPDCTFHYLNLPLTIYDFHSAYVPNDQEQLDVRLMKNKLDARLMKKNVDTL